MLSDGFITVVLRNVMIESIDRRYCFEECSITDLN